MLMVNISVMLTEILKIENISPPTIPPSAIEINSTFLRGLFLVLACFLIKETFMFIFWWGYIATDLHLALLYMFDPYSF